jgi:hypothetical protein
MALVMEPNAGRRVEAGIMLLLTVVRVWHIAGMECVIMVKLVAHVQIVKNLIQGMVVHHVVH